MADALTHIREKLKRADEHVQQLEREATAFEHETPNREIIDYDAQSEKAFKDFHAKRIVPPRLSVLTGDALHQLRSSLDHLVCALILRDGGTLTDRSQFPIFRFQPVKPEDLRRYQRQIEGIKRPAVLAALDGLQPYTRGNRRDAHWLAILKKLSNTDKHRSLVLHVSAVQPRISYSTFWPDEGFEGSTDAIDDGTPVTPGLHIVFRERLEVMDVKRRLTSFVAFDKWPDAPYDLRIGYGMSGLLRGVTQVVDEFAPFLT